MRVFVCVCVCVSKLKTKLQIIVNIQNGNPLQKLCWESICLCVCDVYTKGAFMNVGKHWINSKQSLSIYYLFNLSLSLTLFS